MPLLPASCPDPAAPAAADAQGTLHRQHVGRLLLLAAANQATCGVTPSWLHLCMRSAGPDGPSDTLHVPCAVNNTAQLNPPITVACRIWQCTRYLWQCSSDVHSGHISHPAGALSSYTCTYANTGSFLPATFAEMHHIGGRAVRGSMLCCNAAGAARQRNSALLTSCMGAVAGAGDGLCHALQSAAVL